MTRATRRRVRPCEQHRALQRRQRLHADRHLPGRRLHGREPGRLHGARPVPRRRHLRHGDRALLEPAEDRRDGLQRRQRVHADRHLPGRRLHGRQPGRLHGAGPVPRRRHLRHGDRALLEPAEDRRDGLHATATPARRPTPARAASARAGTRSSARRCDQCHDVGTCDTGTGLCSNPPKTDGTGCTDGDACTQTDTCQGGVCTGGNPVVCTALDQCHDAGTCDTGTGLCSNPPKTDGTACTDGNACTQTDTCQGGVCTGGNPVVCTALDQCHDAGTCDTGTGLCSNPPKTDGTTCTDGSACTTADACAGGVCVGGPALNCDDSNVCTDDTCNPATGCVHTNNTASCNDGNACTTADACAGGVCVGGPALNCDDGNVCTDDSCNPATGCVHTNNTASCSDGNACTQTDTCQGGVCTGGNPVVCTALDQCHDAGTCDTGTGLCSNPPKTDGTGCTDGDACTQTDTCQGGVCTGGSPVVCTALDQCHDAGTCDTGTGLCSNPPKTDGTGCTDGNACTQTDTCQGGVCTGGNPVVCTALDQCHDAGTCDTGTGLCSNPPKTDGTACTDGNACTQTDTCQGGVCTGGNPVVCTALDQCHDAGTCDTGTGLCSNPPKTDGTGCTDGDACTQTDTCQGGVCTGGTRSSARRWTSATTPAPATRGQGSARTRRRPTERAARTATPARRPTPARAASARAGARSSARRWTSATTPAPATRGQGSARTRRRPTARPVLMGVRAQLLMRALVVCAWAARR